MGGVFQSCAADRALFEALQALQHASAAWKQSLATVTDLQAAFSAGQNQRTSAGAPSIAECTKLKGNWQKFDAAHAALAVQKYQRIKLLKMADLK